MKKNEARGNGTYQTHPVGFVRGSEGDSRLEILEPFRPALKELDRFSHVMVFWWAHECDNKDGRKMLQAKPEYAPDHLTGVFACRAPSRPNPIAVTTCKMVEVQEDKGIVGLEWIDAIDGTPILDLKAYYPVCERVKKAKVPEWISDWPQWHEEAYKLSF